MEQLGLLYIGAMTEFAILDVEDANLAYSINFVECLPVFLRGINSGRCLNCSSKQARPDKKILEPQTVDILGQMRCILAHRNMNTRDTIVVHCTS